MNVNWLLNGRKCKQMFFPTEHVKMQKECRNGVLLDSLNNWEVVSYGMNYIEDLHTIKIWDPNVLSKKCGVYEKIDGTLFTLYFYGEEWNISMRCLHFSFFSTPSFSHF